jgi:hypothetical protein
MCAGSVTPTGIFNSASHHEKQVLHMEMSCLFTANTGDKK